MHTGQIALRSLCIGLLIGGFVLAGCGGKVDLRLDLNEGDSRIMKVTSVAKSDESAKAMGAPSEVAESLTFAFEVESVDPNGVATLKVTFREADVGGALKEAMGAAGGAPVDLQPVLDAMDFSGKSFSMKLTPKGRVEEVDGMRTTIEEMAEKLEKEMAKVMDAQLESLGLPPAQRAQMSQMMTGMFEPMLRSQFGDSALREGMESTLDIYPDERVGVGDTWRKGRIVNYGKTPHCASETWTLKARKDGVATLDMTAAITPNTEAPPISMGPMTVELSVSGQQTRVVEVDETTGWITAATANVRLEIEQKMTGLMPMDLTNNVETMVTIETWAE
ncbi:MAG TPA: hypothetical protein HPP77_06055 [Candidatus Hydrogenedentes bacterium]|nr:hypothetical protein [Candidatus Hydrogenedentota bacterium]